jgi:hypothetical protein
VSGHALNHRLQCFFPGRLETSRLQTLKALVGTSFCYRARLDVHLLLQPSFLDAYVRQGNFLAMSCNTHIDHVNTIAFFNGKLYMTISPETFKELGLSAQKTSFRRHDRYNITVDLKAPSFNPGKRLYERVLWCLKRIHGWDFVVAWMDDDGHCRPIKFPESSLSKKVLVSVKEDTFAATLVPSSPDVLGPSAEKDPAGALGSFFDYIGLVALGCPPTSSILADFGQPSLKSLENLTMRPCESSTAISGMGLIAASTIEACLLEVRKLVSSKLVPWASVAVWGFADAPQSWDGQEHSVSPEGAGDNNYVFVVLPDDEYILYVSVASLDATQL